MKTIIGGLSALVCLAFLFGATARAESPDDEYRHLYLESINYEKAGDYESATKSMSSIKTTAANAYQVNIRLGWLNYYNAKYQNAKLAYNAAIKLNASSIEAKQGYLLTMMALLRFDEAESTARAIIKSDPNNYYANLRLSYCLRMQKKGSQAEKIANDMLMLYPSDVSFMVELGYAYLLMNNANSSRKVFTEVLLLNPDNVWAKEQLR